MFKSGIPIGTINADEDVEIDEDKVVNFHRRFFSAKIRKSSVFFERKKFFRSFI